MNSAHLIAATSEAEGSGVRSSRAQQRPNVCPCLISPSRTLLPELAMPEDARTLVAVLKCARTNRARLDTITVFCPCGPGGGTPPVPAAETAALHSAGVRACGYWQRLAARSVAVFRCS